MQIDSSFKPYGYIYTVTNKINGKQYVGQALEYRLKKRWSDYMRLQNCRKQPKLYNVLKKYGPENFLYEILDTTPDQIVQDYLEDFYIECLDTIENGYNCKGGGHNGRLSEETRKKISDSNMGKIHSAETRQKLSIANMGKTRSDASRRRISESHKGIKQSKETILKRKESNKNYIMSDETKQKLSIAHTGKKCRPNRAQKCRK